MQKAFALFASTTSHNNCEIQIEMKSKCKVIKT